MSLQWIPFLFCGWQREWASTQPRTMWILQRLLFISEAGSTWICFTLGSCWFVCVNTTHSLKYPQPCEVEHGCFPFLQTGTWDAERLGDSVKAPQEVCGRAGNWAQVPKCQAGMLTYQLSFTLKRTKVPFEPVEQQLPAIGLWATGPQGRRVESGKGGAGIARARI